jgi:cytochrome c
MRGFFSVRRLPWVCVVAAAVMLCGCTGGHHTRSASIAMGGDPDDGHQLILRYKCGSCHTIPGVDGANGVFGPPLYWMGRRTEVAGNFPNSPDMLTHWIQSPQEMKPGTAMPDLGLSEQQARDVAAYLYTLR